MDFLYSSNESSRPMISRIFREVISQNVKVLDATDEIAGGSLIYTESPYRTTRLVTRGEYSYLAMGDGLVEELSDWKSNIPHGEEEVPVCLEGRPNHPYSLLTFQHQNGGLSVLKDVWGSIPVYFSQKSDDLIVASSPDIIAWITSVTIDDLAIKELLVSGQVCFPNTLYKEIKQCAPGAVTKFSKGKPPETEFWWRPPLPDDGPGPEEWVEEIEESSKWHLRQIKHQIGAKGSIALSAGFDSRYLLSFMGDEAGFEIDARNVTAAWNLESYSAKKVAKVAGVGFGHHIRRADHYAKLALAEPIELGTHNRWKNAHFYEGELTRDDIGGFVIGGYMADTVLANGDPLWVQNKRLKSRGLIDQGAPRWVRFRSYAGLTEDDCEEIEQRWKIADEFLGLTEFHSENLRNVFPASRQGDNAHFEAARRSYPMYELFMTRRALELGFKIPFEVKEKLGKKGFFEERLKMFSEAPINPGSDSSIKEAIQKFKKNFPKELWPDVINHVGSWGAVEGEATKELRGREVVARDVVADYLDRDLTGAPSDLIYQVWVALGIASKHGSDVQLSPRRSRTPSS